MSIRPTRVEECEEAQVEIGGGAHSGAAASRRCGWPAGLAGARGCPSDRPARAQPVGHELQQQLQPRRCHCLRPWTAAPRRCEPRDSNDRFDRSRMSLGGRDEPMEIATQAPAVRGIADIDRARLHVEGAGECPHLDRCARVVHRGGGVFVASDPARRRGPLCESGVRTGASKVGGASGSETLAPLKRNLWRNR